MRLDFYVPLLFVRPDVDEHELVAPPRAVDGRRADDQNLADYLDFDLVVLGIAGGISEIAFVDEACYLRLSYWSPGSVDEAIAERLTAEVRGQMSDGAGENGYDFDVDGVRFWARPLDEGEIRLEQVEDGRVVPPANPVAIAANDGDAEGVVTGLTRNPEDANRPLMNIPPLNWALSGKSEAAVAALLDAGADPNRASEWGPPPVVSCILNTTVDDATTARLLTLLLRAGADPAMEYSGKRPMEWASERKKPASSELLRLAVEARS